MTKEEFNIILKSVKASDVHKTYSVNAGFIAITDRSKGREVISTNDPFSVAESILYQFNIPLCVQ